MEDRARFNDGEEALPEKGTKRPAYKLLCNQDSNQDDTMVGLEFRGCGAVEDTPENANAGKALPEGLSLLIWLEPSRPLRMYDFSNRF